MRTLPLILLLAGCSMLPDVIPVPPAPAAPPAPVPIVSCPPATLVPAPLPRVASTDYLAQVAADLQRTLEKERARGDACAEAVKKLELWIQETRT